MPRDCRRRPVGSSPLTRGKHTLSHGLPRIPRLIPAHAGKTLRLRSGPVTWPAHPRSRGENLAEWRQNRHAEGSSPLTRGKLADEQVPGPRRRLIPAHAGKTRPNHREPCPNRAHPRSRGENRRGLSWRVLAGGSSPLTRGKLHHLSNRFKPCGLIPAHAGKTSGARVVLCAGWAHPRSRGENDCFTSQHVALGGSSPLTRGKLP